MMKRFGIHIALAILMICASAWTFAAKAVPKLQNKIKCPVLLVAFEDIGFTVQNPKQSFNALLNKKGYSANGGTGSAAEYLNANFSGICTFEFIVSDVITLPYPIAKFGAPGSTFNDSDVIGLVIEACKAASINGFDFSACDTDADGVVDNVSIIFAGYGESDGGAPETIWPHQQFITGNSVVSNGITIASYTVTPELKGGKGGTISPIGTFCHEYLHSLGLQDLYDTNGELEGLSPAMYGSLSIMDKGHYLNDGNTPPFLNAIEREMLGIAEVVELRPDTSYSLPPVHSSNKIYRISSSTENEYFLLEYRNGLGWDRYIGGKGLVVYHIDKSDNIYGGIASSSRWQYNNINSYAPHECARILPAAPVNKDNGALFFPGTSEVCELLSKNGHSQLKEWNGYSVGIGIEGIEISEGKLKFRTIMDYSFNDSLPAAYDCRKTGYQRDAKIWWKSNGEEESYADAPVQWLVSWHKQGETDLSESIQDSTCCKIYGLEPGSTYNVRIRSLYCKEFGEPANVIISTAPITSAYPYIYLSGERYGIGDTVDLRIYNLIEEYNSIVWYVDGKRIDEDFIIVDKEGYIELEVVIEYKDGSREKIYKEILAG